MRALSTFETESEDGFFEQTLFPIVESSGKKVVNIASVKHRSPFRYPGGKTWFVPVVRQWLKELPQPPKHFAEPFAGGSIVGLSVLFDGLVESITLVEKDPNVGAVWETIVNGGAPELARMITGFDVSAESVRALFDETLEPHDILKRAFVTIVRNRVQRGGIMAPGASLMRNGENGRGIKSRWYPETLKNRLLDLHSKHSDIQFKSGDGIKFIKDNASNTDFAWFLDPPYTVAGRRLYLHSELDHEKLFAEAAKVKGPLIMTYDDTIEIRALASKHDFMVTEIPMKNSHHAIMNELLIGRNL